MRKPYSHSQLSTYENCPRQYKFKYIDKIEREEEGIETFMGARVHATLEKLYRDMGHCKHVSLEDLTKFYEEEWEKNWHSSITIVNKSYTAENYREMGRKCITNYYNGYYQTDDTTTLGLEERVKIPMDESGEYILTGYIDRVAKTKDGIFEIHDYKSSSYLPSQEKLDMDRQLAFYQIAIQNKWREAKAIKLIWHYLLHDMNLSSSRSEIEINKLKAETIELVNKIEAEIQFEPKESKLCEWCVYQDLCPSRKHLVKVKALPVNKYFEDSGVQLVNNYMKFLEEKKKIEEEIEQIKEAVFAFAEKEGMELIYGSDYKLRVKIGTKRKFPTKSEDEEKYLELEELIKKSGKWIEVSKMDSWALDKVIENQGWNKDLMDEILAFASMVEDKRIWASKLKEYEK